MEELEAGGFLFAGDDLGDLEAFEAVLDLRRRGPAHPAGLLGLRARRAPCAACPTSSSTAPTASWT